MIIFFGIVTYLLGMLATWGVVDRLSQAHWILRLVGIILWPATLAAIGVILIWRFVLAPFLLWVANALYNFGRSIGSFLERLWDK